MKGPREMKRYIAKNRKLLKDCHFDNRMIFKFEKFKKWFKRNKKVDLTGEE